MMPVDLIILGAGGSSREILGAVEDINRQAPGWRGLGFLDDDPALQGKSVDGLPVLGPMAAAKEHTAQLIIGVASWRRLGVRREIVTRLGLPRERYATVIHPSASINSRVPIGAGTAILQNVVITSGSVVGESRCLDDAATCCSGHACQCTHELRMCPSAGTPRPGHVAAATPSAGVPHQIGR